MLPLIRGVEPRGSAWRRLGGVGSLGDTYPPAISSVVVDAPMSRYAEAIRAIKVAADARALGPGKSVIGVTSSIANEGKTTVAVNLARSLALVGQRVLLVDADFRNPALSMDLAGGVKHGLLDVLTKNVAVSSVALKDPLTGMQILPIALGEQALPPNEYLSSQAMSDLLKSARIHFDAVILDLPPIAPVADVKSCTHLLDGIVFVIEWGATLSEVVEKSVNAVADMRDKMLGCVLNKVDLKRINSFPGYSSREFSSKYYRDYAPSA